LQAIAQKGFDERHAYIGGMFGAGIYFAGTARGLLYSTFEYTGTVQYQSVLLGTLLTCSKIPQLTWYKFKNTPNDIV
jgi:hypothetical protein